jgi:hypothetical protein
VFCQLRPEPVACASRKQKVAAAVQAPALKKATEKCKCPKGSSRSMGQMSAQELALTKPLKESKKFISQSSGLSVTEKSSSTTIKITGGKTSSSSTGGSGAAPAPTHALDLFDSGLSSSTMG